MAIIVDLSVIKHGLIQSRDLSIEFKVRPELIKHYILNSILYIKSQFQASKKNELILAIDRRKVFKNADKTVYGYWRDVLYEQKKPILSDSSKGYKFGRERSAEFDWETIERCYSETLGLIRDFTDIKVIEIPGIEADDICAVLAQKILDVNIIISSDKDLKKLVSDTILLYDWCTKKYETKRTSKEEKLLFYLYGDSGDGIKSVKPRYQWEKNLKVKSLDEIFAQFPDLPLKERFLFNKKLMDLSVESLPKSVTTAILDEYYKPQGSYHQIKIITELNKLGLSEMVEGDIRSITNRSTEFQLPNVVVSKDSEKSKQYKMNIAKENLIREKFLN